MGKHLLALTQSLDELAMHALVVFWLALTDFDTVKLGLAHAQFVHGARRRRRREWLVV
jgi:hypothetical protein